MVYKSSTQSHGPHTKIVNVAKLIQSRAIFHNPQEKEVWIMKDENENNRTVLCLKRLNRHMSIMLDITEDFLTGAAYYPIKVGTTWYKAILNSPRVVAYNQLYKKIGVTDQKTFSIVRLQYISYQKRKK